MYGLGGAEKGKVEKLLVFKAFLNGSKGARVRQPNEQGSEKLLFWGISGSL